MAKSACIFGSTGLIGSHLLSILLNDNRYDKIVLFNRTLQPVTNPNIVQIVADYGSLDQYANQLKTDDYYCCLGTTMKKAKNRQAFEYVDFNLPLAIAKLALENEVPKLLVVSSIGASAKSGTFYLRVKGLMEIELGKIGIKHLHFFRPSMLLGKRNEKRFAESAGMIIMKIFGFLLVGKLKKYRAIKGEIVAEAMVVVANGSYSNISVESDEIQKLGAKI